MCLSFFGSNMELYRTDEQPSAILIIPQATCLKKKAEFNHLV